MSKLLRPLKEVSLTNKVENILREYIIKKDLKEGDKLPTERELCEQLKVSRNVVREALKSLESSGIIYKIQGKGIFLNVFNSNITTANIFFGLVKDNSVFKELLEVRKSFEITILKLLIDKITDEDINNLQNIIDNFQKEDFKNTVLIDIKFHILLLEILKNDFIKRLGMVILESFRELPIDRLDKVEDKNDYVEKLFIRHKKIIMALKERNLDKAINAMEDHFKKAYLTGEREEI